MLLSLLLLLVFFLLLSFSVFLFHLSFTLYLVTFAWLLSFSISPSFCYFNFCGYCKFINFYGILWAISKAVRNESIKLNPQLLFSFFWFLNFTRKKLRRYENWFFANIIQRGWFSLKVWCLCLIYFALFCLFIVSFAVALCQMSLSFKFSTVSPSVKRSGDGFRTNNDENEYRCWLADWLNLVLSHKVNRRCGERIKQHVKFKPKNTFAGLRSTEESCINEQNKIKMKRTKKRKEKKEIEIEIDKRKLKTKKFIYKRKRKNEWKT